MKYSLNYSQTVFPGLLTKEEYRKELDNQIEQTRTLKREELAKLNAAPEEPPLEWGSRSLGGGGDPLRDASGNVVTNAKQYNRALAQGVPPMSTLKPSATPPEGSSDEHLSPRSQVLMMASRKEAGHYNSPRHGPAGYAYPSPPSSRDVPRNIDSSSSSATSGMNFTHSFGNLPNFDLRDSVWLAPSPKYQHLPAKVGRELRRMSGSLHMGLGLDHQQGSGGSSSDKEASMYMSGTRSISSSQQKSLRGMANDYGHESGMGGTRAGGAFRHEALPAREQGKAATRALKLKQQSSALAEESRAGEFPATPPAQDAGRSLAFQHFTSFILTGLATAKCQASSRDAIALFMHMHELLAKQGEMLEEIKDGVHDIQGQQHRSPLMPQECGQALQEKPPRGGAMARSFRKREDELDRILDGFTSRLDSYGRLLV
ncbi:unnamed protein product [Chrysoparadoxa australica]